MRHIAARSSYVVLPLLAFANAGVVPDMDARMGHQPLVLAALVGVAVLWNAQRPEPGATPQG